MTKQEEMARLRAAFLGHKLGNFIRADKDTVSAGCQICTKTVTIKKETVYGAAIVEHCPELK